ncbi:histidine kinase [Amycolatopsis carbonis]|uniref:histidine kinase n=1 Tax=Amycolatopsis carbonis TaxID=715471 RepID=A0A9Y2IDN5_9PSEU|nr:histidine kinase [Amycolatopsis sp. 2-15]WIX77584.1 histidine kinase [Amycolatopsis sp. 2-15]
MVTATPVAHLVTSAPRNLDYLPVLLAPYTAPMSPRPLVRFWLCGATTAAVGAAMVPAEGLVDGALLTAALRGVAWLLGVERRRHVAERAEFAAQRTRHRLERLAAERRDRTARRLHDTLARTTTVMLVQAEALRAVGDLTDGDRRRVDAMLSAGRDALDQVRATLRELHGEEEPAAEPALADVLDQLRSAGLVLDAVPDATAFPGAVRPLAGRVIAEAATNALRHHGPGTRLGVDVAAASSGSGSRRRSRPRRPGKVQAPAAASPESPDRFLGVVECGSRSSTTWRTSAARPLRHVRRVAQALRRDRTPAARAIMPARSATGAGSSGSWPTATRMCGAPARPVKHRLPAPTETPCAASVTKVRVSSGTGTHSVSPSPAATSRPWSRRASARTVRRPA